MVPGIRRGSNVFKTLLRAADNTSGTRFQIEPILHHAAVRTKTPNASTDDDSVSDRDGTGPIAETVVGGVIFL